MDSRSASSQPFLKRSQRLQLIVNWQLSLVIDSTTHESLVTSTRCRHDEAVMRTYGQSSEYYLRVIDLQVEGKQQWS
jgi:hypothetical protein